MKKLLSVLPIAAAVCLISCNSKDSGSGMSDAAKKNLDAMHGINKCFETKDFSKIGDYIAADGVDHAGENGDVKGLDSIKATMVKMSAMTEGDKTSIIKELADDEYVMQWAKYSGKMTMDAMGMKKGDVMEMTSIEVCKFKDGKATEHWTMMEPKECMKMMAAMGPMKPMDDMKKDTTASKMEPAKK